MNKLPWMKYDPDIIALDEEGMTLEEEGAYSRCVRHLWRHGALAEARLSRLCGAAWPAVKASMEEREGLWSFGWLEDARGAAKAWVQQRSEAGKASAATRNDRSTNPQREPNDRSTVVLSPSLSHSSSGSSSTQEGKERAHEPEVIPAGCTAPMWEAIKRWGQYRREKRLTLTPSGRAAFLKKCIEWGEERAVAAIDHSILQGWTGCYEPKNTAPTSPKHMTDEQYVQESARVARANYERRLAADAAAQG